MYWGILISLALLQSYVLANDVVILTDDNFESTIQNNPYVMVKFFAPWCGHCKEFAPEYEEAAKKAKELGKPYILADLDATIHKEAAKKEHIEGFPTIKLYINGKAIDYNGERTKDEVLTFLDKKTGPASIKLETKEDITKIKDGKNLRCILGTERNDMQTIYEDTARAEDDYMFYHTTPELLGEVFPEAKEDNIVLLKDFDEKVVIYNEKLDSTKLKEFLDTNSIPLAGDIDLKLVKLVFTPHGRTGVFLFVNPDTDNAEILKREFKNTAIALRGPDNAFGVVDLKTEWGGRVAEFFGIEESALPVLEVIKMKADIVRYRLPEKITEANIKKFLEDCNAEKVERFFKSEPEPKENSGPVRKVVGKTFKREVMDNDDDIIMLFYAPWCGHCQKFDPIYEELAKTLANNKKLKFMKIDAAANDIEGHTIQGFPTIKFFPGKDKERFIPYEGERSAAEVAKFIKEKASHPVEIPEFKSKDEEDLGKEDL